MVRRSECVSYSQRRTQAGVTCTSSSMDSESPLFLLYPSVSFHRSTSDASCVLTVAMSTISHNGIPERGRNQIQDNIWKSLRTYEACAIAQCRRTLIASGKLSSGFGRGLVVGLKGLPSGLQRNHQHISDIEGLKYSECRKIASYIPRIVRRVWRLRRQSAAKRVETGKAQTCSSCAAVEPRDTSGV